MTKTFVTADPHFSHWGVCKFLRSDGITKLRPWDDPRDMDEELVDRWNSVVNNADRVYLLGDVCFKKSHIHILGRLKGRIVLVKGNHDTLPINSYLPYVDDIRACVVKKGFILTHVPIHPDSLERWGVNIHGHLHANKLRDKRYKCVSVEHTNYTPITIEEALEL